MAESTIFFLIGLAVGAAAGWVIAFWRERSQAAYRIGELDRRAAAAEGLVAELRGQTERIRAESDTLRGELGQERELKARAETQADEAKKNLQDQKDLLAEARTRLLEAFKALSSESLQTNNQAFLDLAGKSFQVLIAEATGDVGKRQEAIDALIKPLTSALERYEQHIKQLEESRQKAYGALEEQVRSLAGTQERLHKETNNLVTALRAPQVRGRWGELTLHRVVELAGMSEHCDYEEQVSVDTEDGKLRPDMVVHLPSKRDIVVDSKVSLVAYLNAVSAETEEQRKEFLRQHAQQLRAHMHDLSGKQYWAQFKRSPEFVVMFIPGESFFASALDCDPALLVDGMGKRVVLATPTTLIALLWAVAYGWRQELMEENARIISQLGKDLYDRIRVFASYVISLRKSLTKTNNDFNEAVASLEGRLLPAARKFQGLGVGGTEGIPTVEQMDVSPRSLGAEDVTPPPGPGEP